MIKRIFLLALYFSLPLGEGRGGLAAQDLQLVDSLTKKLFKAKEDTAKANILFELASAYKNSIPEKVIEYAKQTIELSERIKFKKGIANGYSSMGIAYWKKGEYSSGIYYQTEALKIYSEINYKTGMANSNKSLGVIDMSKGNFPEAQKKYFHALKIYEEIFDKKGIASCYGNLGSLYLGQKNYSLALKNYFAGLKLRIEINDKYGIGFSYENIGNTYRLQNKFKEALKNSYDALEIYKTLGEKGDMAGMYQQIGQIYSQQNNHNEALKNYFLALKNYEEIGFTDGIPYCCIDIGKSFSNIKKYSEAEKYFRRALSLSSKNNNLEVLAAGNEGLAILDSTQGNFKQELEHYKLYIIYRDSLINNHNAKEVTEQRLQNDFDKKQSIAKAEAENKLRIQQLYTIGGLSILGIVSILLFFVFRNYKKQKLANKTLKETQKQLVESEKLAAFGSVATRVAHEILNPLNFVNNFSQISSELTDEIAEAKTEEEKKELLYYIKSNLKKINHHGKRADAIVKELFEHSRAGTIHEYFDEEKNKK